MQPQRWTERNGLGKRSVEVVGYGESEEMNVCSVRNKKREPVGEREGTEIKFDLLSAWIGGKIPSHFAGQISIGTQALFLGLDNGCHGGYRGPIFHFRG